MKTTRYEVRFVGMVVKSEDNLFEIYDYYDKYCFTSIGDMFTIHEITTTEKDITHTAKIEKDGLG